MANNQISQKKEKEKKQICANWNLLHNECLYPATEAIYCEQTSWQFHHSTQFQINKTNRKLEHAISFNGPYPFIKKAPHQHQQCQKESNPKDP